MLESMQAFSYDEKVVTNRYVRNFPQFNMMKDYGLFAQAPGDYPSGCVPDFESDINPLDQQHRIAQLLLIKFHLSGTKRTTQKHECQ